MKARKTFSPKRVRAASRRRRRRMMRRMFRPVPREPDGLGQSDGGWGAWESDAYGAERWLDASAGTREDGRWNNDWPSDAAWASPAAKGPHRARKRLLQGIFSVVLVAAVWLIETSTHPKMASVQYWVSETVSRDFDFSAVQSWYERHFASSPSLLPAFASNWFGASVPASTVEWQPLSGEVVKVFSPQHQGIRLAVGKNSEVPALGTGWVVDVGQRPGLGMTVVVQHSRGNQTWYAQLGEVLVAEDDWVYAGDPIGRAGVDGEWFLALRQQDAFVDPTSVLPRDE